MPLPLRTKEEIFATSEAVLETTGQTGKNHAVNSMLIEMQCLLDEMSPMEDFRKIPPLETENGVAISPDKAGECIADFERTKMFWRGLHGAINEAKRRFPGEKIRILYAGCGPYATLALAMLSHFSPDEIEFQLLDLHEESVENAERIINRMNLQDYFTGYECCDAANYKVSIPPHIVLSETMDRALANEPQAAIVANLVPQMRKGGLLVPEEITVNIASMSSMNVTNKRILGTLMKLSASPEDFPVPKRAKAVVRVPKFPEEEITRIALTTNIRVYESIWLLEEKADITRSITMPLFFKDGDLPATLSLDYKVGGMLTDLNIQISRANEY